MAQSRSFTVADADVRPGRIQKSIRGTGERPRLCVYRSNKHIYAQLINDNTAHTLVQASSVEDEIRKEADDKSQQEISKLVGQRLAEKADEEGIGKAVFDRNNYRYHGRVKALAEGAREGGLSF